MHACKRNLLALAVSAILLPGLALADKPTNTGHAAKQPPAAAATPRPSMPTPAVEHAEDALKKNPNYDPANTRDVGKDVADADDVDDDSDDDDADDKATGGTHSGMSEHGAAQSNPGKGNWWTDADSDADGRISRTEAKVNSGLDTRFASIDTNSDGFVTRDEYAAYYRANASQGEQHAADHSAVVTRDVWTRFDANSDGKLSALEVALDTGLKTDFGAVDANADGFVTQDEYRTYYQNH